MANNMRQNSNIWSKAPPAKLALLANPPKAFSPNIRILLGLYSIAGRLTGQGDCSNILFAYK